MQQLICSFACLIFLAWVGSLAMALTNFSGFISGALLKRFSCRVTTILGGLLCSLSLGLSSLATNILTLYLTYSVLYGLGTSCVFSASLNIRSASTSKRGDQWRLGLLLTGKEEGSLSWVLFCRSWLTPVVGRPPIK